MGTLAVKAENLSKRYRLGEVGTGTLSHDLNRWFAKLRGLEDPILKIDQNEFESNGDLWALQDINLEVHEGEVLGLIGNNGAGKSTLLKILSKITKPTSGRVFLNGRITSLLEVGTGFHPEMTGRENIFLNGAIMGMKHRETKARFDEIVEFSGVGRHIDTPVKRYSSGMYVRLAFAVAAHLNAETLIVDEVLAVGDAEFQRKCLGKMSDVSKTQGKTILFVSHNIAAISRLCDKSALLDKGRILMHDDTAAVVSHYQNQHLARESEIPFSLRKNRNGSGEVRITDFNYSMEPQMGFKLTYDSECEKFRGRLYISVYDSQGNAVLFLDSDVHTAIPTEFPGKGEFRIQLSESVRLSAGSYTVNVAILKNGEWVDHIEGALQIKVPESDFYLSGKSLFHKPLIHVKQRWQLQEHVAEFLNQ